ncbi:Gfo/Idh/MocA family oxidoreductase [Candidatus Daviesbacteria bacterium]|nr:Gfo/Idh/MocA family oxidoreductase [Candidatus Daviesbacteria bacterium]
MIKVGIIGSGFGLYGLLPAFNSTVGCKVIAICGKKTERLVKYCQSIGLGKIYTSWQEMLATEKINAVAIAVPPNAQHNIIRAALRKNLHIFAEKPLALNYQQAKELLRIATKKKITNAVDFIFPEIEAWQKVKEMIDKKVYGKLRHISLNWDFLSYDIKNKISSWKTNTREGGGALSYYFSHSLYYLEYLAGEITGIKSQFFYSKESINSGEVGLDLLLSFKTGIKGYAHISISTKVYNKHQLIFQCEKGAIILKNESGSVTDFVIKIYSEKKETKIKLKEKPKKIDEDERVRIVKKIAARFIYCCAHKEQMIPSFKEGVRVQELIGKIRSNL